MRITSSMVLLVGLLGWTHLACAAEGDAFEIPSTWRLPAFKGSRNERIEVATRAMDQVIANVSLPSGLRGMDSWQAANVLTSVVMAEYATGTTRYKGPITEVLSQIASGHGFMYMYWGQTCLYAYRAYKVPQLLELAQGVWEQLFKYSILEEHAASGTHPERNVTFMGSCNGQSTSGGIFYINSAANMSDLQARSNVIGPFIVLSAHLAELTGNKTYQDAATRSAAFLQAHLMSSINHNLVTDGIRLYDCFQYTDTNTYNTAQSVHGITVLADVTKEVKWKEFAHKSLLAGMRTLLWQGPDGILKIADVGKPTDGANSQGSKGLYMRSFYEPWIRNADNKTLTAFIEAYVAVQYNALRDLASVAGSDYYSPDWHGPGVAYWNQGGVMASTPLLALSVSSAAGNAAINGSSDSSASSPNSDSGTDPKRSNIGLIVGAVVGAVVGLALLGICGFCLMRRADRRVPHNRHTGGEDVLKEELLLEQVSRAPSPEGSHVVLPFRSKRREAGLTQEDDDPTKYNRAGSHGKRSRNATPAFTTGSTTANASSTAGTSGTGAPVADLVELVYQRLQQDRPPYDQSSAPPPAYGPPQVTYSQQQVPSNPARGKGKRGQGS